MSNVNWTKIVDGATLPMSEQEIALETEARAVHANAQERVRQLRALASTDARMARVVEDVIDVLTTKGVIADGDFPAPVRALLVERKAARALLAGGSP